MVRRQDRAAAIACTGARVNVPVPWDVLGACGLSCDVTKMGRTITAGAVTASSPTHVGPTRQRERPLRSCTLAGKFSPRAPRALSETRDSRYRYPLPGVIGTCRHPCNDGGLHGQSAKNAHENGAIPAARRPPASSFHAWERRCARYRRVASHPPRPRRMARATPLRRSWNAPPRALRRSPHAPSGNRPPRVTAAVSARAVRRWHALCSTSDQDWHRSRSSALLPSAPDAVPSVAQRLFCGARPGNRTRKTSLKQREPLRMPGAAARQPELRHRGALRFVR